MSRATFLAAVREYHLRWALDAEKNMPSPPQDPEVIGDYYSETAVDDSPAIQDEDRYWRRIRQLMNEHLPNP